MFTKYPRTPHLPWSPGVTSDDVIAQSLSVLQSSEIVVTEKMDGENTTLYRDGLHARSISPMRHISQAWIKRFHQEIALEIPVGMRICGENLYAKHSIYYSALPSYFLVFSIWQDDICLPWHETLEWVALLGLKCVPVLYMGRWSEKDIRECYTGKSLMGGDQEGYVVRNADEFTLSAFSENLAKYVRANHVTTSKHWKHEVITPNGLLL